MNTSNDERRQFHRIRIDLPARLIGPDDHTAVRIIDVSLHGALVQAEDSATLAQTGELVIELSTETHIRMRVTVVHHHGDVAGLRCDELPLDSAVHLRRLVELNLGDPALLERDVEALASAGQAHRSRRARPAQ